MPRKSQPTIGKAPHEIDIQVGRRICVLRQQKGMSQETLGNRLGISFQQVQKYEKGINRVSASRLDEIARVLDVPVQALFGSTNGPDTGPPKDAAILEAADSQAAVRVLHHFNAINDQSVRTLAIRLLALLATCDPRKNIAPAWMQWAIGGIAAGACGHHLITKVCALMMMSVAA